MSKPKDLPDQMMVFHGYLCYRQWGMYEVNSRPALTLMSAQTHEPIARVTINLVNEKLGRDEIAINPDINPNIYLLLIEAKILKRRSARRLYHIGSFGDSIVTATLTNHAMREIGTQLKREIEKAKDKKDVSQKIRDALEKMGIDYE